MKNIISFSPENQNPEGLKGLWGHNGYEGYDLTLLKSVLVINLHKGCKVDTLLPHVYDGFIQLSNGDILEVKDDRLVAELGDDDTGFGILTLKGGR